MVAVHDEQRVLLNGDGNSPDALAEDLRLQRDDPFGIDVLGWNQAFGRYEADLHLDQLDLHLTQRLLFTTSLEQSRDIAPRRQLRGQAVAPRTAMEEARHDHAPHRAADGSLRYP